MSWRAALAVVALAACGKTHPTGCPLDESAVARWMTTQRLGALAPNDPPAIRWYWQEHYAAILFALQNAAISSWCVDRDRFADTTCWTSEAAGRPECEAGRTQLLDSSVGGPLCGRLVRWFGADALALEHGAKLDMRDPQMMQRYSALARRYDAVLDRIKPSMSQLCSYIAGMPLRCYLDPKHETCVRPMATIHRYIDQALTE